jgi:hypothetical protein
MKSKIKILFSHGLKTHGILKIKLKIGKLIISLIDSMSF